MAAAVETPAATPHTMKAAAAAPVDTMAVSVVTRGNAVVMGTVAPGFEAVRALFQQHVSDGIEECAQVCAFVRGEKVVDLWASPPGRGYGAGSLQVWAPPLSRALRMRVAHE